MKWTKGVLNWAKKDLSIIFSIIGIIVTIYLSVFYVPNYIEDAQYRTVNNVNSNLIDIVQELVYKEQEIDVADLKTLIRGKEIKHKIEYPYSSDELLIQVQEAFMENNFIPLEDRKNYIEIIDNLRNEIKKENQNINEKKEEFNLKGIYIQVLTDVSAILGILISVLGTMGIYSKRKNERDNEVKKEVNINTEALRYESMVRENFLKHNINFKICKEDSRCDLRIKRGNKRYNVLIKYFRTNNKINEKIINKLLNYIKQTGENSILITNTVLNNESLEIINNYNEKHDNELAYICANDSQELMEKMKTFLG